jgi:hypothetical protein
LLLSGLATLLAALIVLAALAALLTTLATLLPGLTVLAPLLLRVILLTLFRILSHGSNPFNLELICAAWHRDSSARRPPSKHFEENVKLTAVY